MTYRAEFRQNWRPLLAATTGMSLGLALSHYIMSLFAPAIMADFGWSKAQFALIGSTPFITMLFMPLAGRFIDRAGPRAAATVGFISLPISYLALSFMNGAFSLFFVIMIVKSVFGVLTTTMVFARVIVERFDRARGFALSIVMSGAPLVGALIVPLIAEIISDHGWRNGYRALALISILGGIIAIGLLRDNASPHAKRAPHQPASRAEILALLQSPLLLLLAGGTLLINVPQGLVASQLKLVLMESHASGPLAVGLIALYAIGVVTGRFLCGLTLDKVEAHWVALGALGLPAIGLAAIASPFDAPWILGVSVLLIALAQGAEGDIGAYLISRRFGLKHYSLILSFATIALTLGAASGSLVLSYTLHLTDSYVVFLLISAALTAVGALLFFLTGRYPPTDDAEAVGQRKTRLAEALG